MRRFLSVPIDWFLLGIPIILTTIGIITIYTITYAEYGTALAIDQIIFAVLGLIAMSIFMFSDYRVFGATSKLLYVIGVLSLVPLLPFLAPKLPFVLKIYGAYRWIDLKIFQVQPAEVFKFIAIIGGAKYLAGRIGVLDWRKVIGYLLLAGLPVVLIMMQPDLGTASVILMIFLGMFLVSRPSRTIILVGILLVGISLPLLWSNLQDYQRQRIETFLNPAADPQGEGYNVRQALIAVGSGGLMGRGFGQGSQTTLNFLPVAHADFIFAGFAEATGFIGSAVLILLYVVMLLRIISIARESTDPFGQLVAIGVAVKYAFQMTVHIGMNEGMLPVTGIPLPFMSYGGTALIVDLALIGLLQSIYIRHKKAVFSS